jgi:predicted ABC-type ATPase
VPTEDIERRYSRSFANLPAALAAAERAYLFDNSSQRHRLVLIREINRVKYASPYLPPWAKPFAG